MTIDQTSIFSFRTASVEALSAVIDGDTYPAAIDKAAMLGERFSEGTSTEAPWWAYTRLLRAVSQLLRWPAAVADADPNPLRFRDAARHIGREVHASLTGRSWDEPIARAAQMLSQVEEPADVKSCAKALWSSPLPVLTDRGASFESRSRPQPEPEEKSTPLPVLALVTIEGEALIVPTTLTPNTIYRLGIRARTDAWPVNAVAIVFDFLSILGPRMLNTAPVRMQRHEESAVTTIQVCGNLPSTSTGEDVCLMAAFELATGDRLPVRVLGNPKIRLHTFESSVNLPGGLSIVSSRVHEMLLELDVHQPQLRTEVRNDFFVLLESVVRFAHGEMQRTQFSDQDRIPEETFQSALRRHLQADHRIGGRLKEKVGLASGITDLGLGDVVLELKVEHNRSVAVSDTKDYLSQPAHYGTGNDCPVSILCVLDDSEKVEPPGILANYLGWTYPRTHGLDDPRFPSMVASLVIPTRFPTPSSWSR